jgi:hypothetical protein
MKQHITAQQWKKLRQNKKHAWYDWAVSKGYVKTISQEPHGYYTQVSEELDLPTIGQMLEFLTELSQPGNIFKKKSQEWTVIVPDVICSRPELADAMWEVIQRTLYKS